MNSIELKEEFEKILQEVIEINGLTPEIAVEVAGLILQELGKDRRAEMLKARLNGNEQKPTVKQLRYLERLGIDVPEGITKREASRLIDEARNN